jgi:hypothetical protein
MTNINPEVLYKACVDGDARNLSGPRFQSQNYKSTPLIAATEGGHTEIVRMILARARNTSVDYADAQGFNAQLVAAMYHHADILQLLADRGANVNLLADRRGTTALRLAVEQIEPDSTPRDPDPDGTRQVATVKALFQLGAGTLPPRSPRAPRATLF